MTAARVRIKSVRLKSGGAKMEIFRNREPEELWRNFGEKISEMRCAYESDLAGYAVVMWGGDGSSWSSFRHGQRSKILDAQIPQFVKDTLNRAS